MPIATRRARPDRRAPQERRRGRQHAGLGRDGGEGAARLPAQPEPATSRRGSEDAAHRDLVVRPESRARGSAGAARRFRHRGRLWQRRSRFRQRAGARRRIVGQRAGAAEERDQRSRHRLCRPGTGAAVDHAGVGSGRITPRPFVLRVFAAATADGWTIMPGGFCRIADQPDARAVSMGDGARAADVWVVSDKAVSRPRRCCRRSTTCVSGASPAWCRAAPPTICSGSAAISSAPRRRCGWCGRSACKRDAGKGSPTVLPAIERVQRLLVTWGATSQTSRSQPAKVAAEALQSEEKFGSALSLVRSAQRTATSLRERLSPDAWQVITEMAERLARGGRRRRRRRHRRRTDACRNSRVSRGWRRKT